MLPGAAVPAPVRGGGRVRRCGREDGADLRHPTDGEWNSTLKVSVSGLLPARSRKSYTPAPEMTKTEPGQPQNNRLDERRRRAGGAAAARARAASSRYLV